MNLHPAFWLSYSLRSLRRSGRRVYFAGICVLVGVAAVVALQTAGLTVQSALTANVRAANGGDISVTSESAPLAPADLAVFRQLRRRGLISNWTAVGTLHATAIGPARTLVPFDVDTVTVPPYPLGGQPTFTTPANGQVAKLLQRRGDALVTATLADELGLHPGSRIPVHGIGGPGLTITVRGILSAATLGRAATMTIRRRDASALSSTVPEYSAVYANSFHPNAAANILRTRVPFATVQTVAEALQSNEQEVHDFQQFLLLAGLLTLLIAGVGIFNATQSMLAARRLEIAMLKAMGYPQRVLVLLFGVEAGILGLIGGVLGTALGALVSEVVTNAIARAVGVQVTVVLTPGTLLGGVGLGLVSTLIFALLPIVAAAALRPLEILRPSGSAPVARNLAGGAALLAVVIALFAALAAAIVDDWVLAIEFVAGAAAAFGVMTGIFAAIVSWMSRLGRPRSRLLGGLLFVILAAATILLARRQPAPAIVCAIAALLWACAVFLPDRGLFAVLMAVRSLARRRTRAAVTLVAFLVGVLCMSLTLTVGLTLEGQVSSALASASAVNMVAVANNVDRAQLLRASTRLPGLKDSNAVATLATEPVAINGRRLASVIGPAPTTRREDAPVRMLRGITGWDLARGRTPTQLILLNGRLLTPQDAGTRNVLVEDDLERYPYRLRPGSTITLRNPLNDRTETLNVVGIYSLGRGIRRRNITAFFTQPVYADRAAIAGLGSGGAQTVVSYAVASDKLADDSVALQRNVPGAIVININDITAVVRQILNDLLNVLVVITALAMSAGLAVVGTSVTLAMLERFREIALLKAIGFGPRPVMSFVLIENALGGLIAGAVSVALVALALGALSRFALQNPIGFDPVLALYVVVGTMLLSVLTAYGMARHTVAIRPLDALRNE